MKKAVLLMILIFCVSVAAQGFSFEGTGVERTLKEASTYMINLVVDVISVGLFGIVVWQFVDACRTNTLSQKWFWLVSIGIFAGVLQVFPSIFELIASAASPGIKVR